jgi:hypothetical protein
VYAGGQRVAARLFKLFCFRRNGKMKKLYVCVLAVLAVSTSQALTTTFGSDADTYLRDSTVRGNYGFMDVRGGTNDFAGYLRFDISSLNLAVIENASLILTVSGGASRNDTLVNGRFALYGLNNVEGNTPQNWDEATLSENGTNPVGLEWNGIVPLNLAGGRLTNLDADDGISVTETIVGGGGVGSKLTVTGQALVDFLTARLNDGGLVTFILANDDTSDRGYGIATKENATEAYRPMLEVTYIPEPATMVLLGLGGLLAVRRKQ